MVEFVEMWLYSDRSGCFRAKMVVFGQSGCNQAKFLYSVRSCCIRAKRLY